MRVCFLFAVASALCLLPLHSAESEPVEGAPVFFARDILDVDLLSSPNHRVQPMVEVRDFNYIFRIESEFGRFERSGVAATRKLVHELEVVGALTEMSQSEAFAASLARSFTEPVMMTFGIARRPISTVTGLPGGVVRYLGGKFQQVKRGSRSAMSKFREMRSEDAEAESEGSEENESRVEKVGRSANKLSKRHLGYDDAKRAWARRFGVDPYSQNEALQLQLGRIAWASSLGDLAGDFAVPATEVVSYAGKAQQLVWERSPYQLERENEQRLKKLNISKDLMLAFQDSEAYSITEKTQLCIAFLDLRRASGLEELIALALDARSEEEATLMLRTIGVLGVYGREVSPLASVSIRRGMIAATAANGYLVLPLAADYLHWTPIVYEALLSEAFAADRREVWIAGEVSPVARLRLRDHGWEVFERKLD